MQRFEVHPGQAGELLSFCRQIIELVDETDPPLVAAPASGDTVRLVTELRPGEPIRHFIEVLTPEEVLAEQPRH